ncbi:MAG: tetratricopeptide repeat protein [Methanotrichaceae archaeon]|nr:tetratricopeptide repeat protein [Methanotrichaceae archaeon]
MLKDEDVSVRAIQVLDRTLEIEPNAYDIWYDKGYVLYYQKKYDEAIQATDKAIEINPEFIESCYPKALLSKKQVALKNPMQPTLRPRI